MTAKTDDPHSVKLSCPVGHPSGPGRHCPLCGRAYVPTDEAVSDPYFAMPKPRHALDDHVAMPDLEQVEEGRAEVEALAMLSSLASDFDY